MAKIYIDPGHGGTDPGATANGLKEKDVTLAIATRVRNILVNEYTGVSVRMSRTGDQTVSLSQRTNDANAWGATFYVSIHINAGGGTGYEDYIHSNLSDSSSTAQLRNTIHAEIVKLIDMPNRGKKKADFHVLRETSMHAMLTENGFIDTATDAAKMKTSAWLDKAARGHVNGIAKAFGLKKKAAASTNPPVGEDGELQFSSGTLKKEWETFLGSKAQREIAVKEAVKAGYSAKWIKDLEAGKVQDGDVAALAVGALIRANK